MTYRLAIAILLVCCATGSLPDAAQGIAQQAPAAQEEASRPPAQEEASTPQAMDQLLARAMTEYNPDASWNRSE